MAKSIDLSKLTLKDLKSLDKDIRRAMSAAETKARAAALSDAEKAASKHGFKLKDLMGKAPKAKNATVAPKYRHPENPSVTWSGRGRQPIWFKEALANGAKAQSLEI